MDAYEIRLELLKLAQSIESDRNWSERNRLEQDWQQKIESHNKLAKSIHPPAYPVLPDVTHEDVVRVAEELNKFISKK